MYSNLVCSSSVSQPFLMISLPSYLSVIMHSDNAINRHNIRSNFRCYTCILYCNDSWKMDKDGGALIIYPNSVDILDCDEASRLCEGLEINPVNGRLVIFDSRLMHAVQPVTQSVTPRRALSLWIKRPEARTITLA